MNRTLDLFALCLVAVPGAAHAEAPAPAFSLHGGIGYGSLVEPSLHLQVEGSFWFLEGEGAFGVGGNWVFSEMVLLRLGLIAPIPLHPYVSAGGGAIWAYDGESGSGVGPGLSFEAGLLLGKDRPWGRIAPFVQLDRALWTVNKPGPQPGSAYHWAPGWRYPIVGLKVLF